MSKLGFSPFDWATDERGYFARLRDGQGREVRLCDWPGSLLSMLRAKVLGGQAKEDAIDQLRLQLRAQLSHRGGEPHG